MKRVLISGGAGFLGSHLCERLLAEGHSVVSVDNYSTGAPDNLRHLSGHPRLRQIDADVTRELPVRGRFDEVLHLASPASPTAYLRMPVETLLVGSTGTLRMLDVARAGDARFLLASTSEVYGDPLVHPQPETYWGNVNPVGPRAVYDEAKRFGEALTTAYRTSYGVDTTIARLFNCYGPRMCAGDGRMVPTFIEQALRGEPLTVTGTGEQTRSVCYMDDTVEGIVRLLRSDHPGPMNIGSEHELSVLGIAELIKKLTGSRSRIEFVPRPVDDPTFRRPDLTLARTTLGWTPTVSVREGLRRTIAWHLTRRTANGHESRPGSRTDGAVAGSRSHYPSK
jgi:dTDP-glucose 4,6-dehydratase